MQALLFIGCRPARRLACVLAITVAAAVLAACGSAGQPEPAATTAVPDSIAHSESHSAAAAGEPKTAAAMPADPVVINLDIANRAVALTRQDLQARQGDTVSLRITSDEPGEIHLHGYDLTAAVSPDAPGELTFRADTAGAFGVNFHALAPAPAAATDAGAGHGAMSHGPIESEVPVSVGVAATVEDDGGVNVRINAENWRWAPENVNGANIAGEGHAHIYVNGAKINRVYGPDYHIKNLPPGEHQIRVTLNANGHNALLVDGEPVEAATTVTVADHGHTHDAQPAPVAAEAPMSVDISVDEDPDGGYNLRVIPTGFAFAGGNVNQPFVPGIWEGHAYVDIDGNGHARLYEPWLIYQQVALSRAEVKPVHGVGDVRFLAVEDVLIHKTIASRWQDEEDIVSILKGNPELDEAYMGTWLRKWEIEESYAVLRTRAAVERQRAPARTV